MEMMQDESINSGADWKEGSSGGCQRTEKFYRERARAKIFRNTKYLMENYERIKDSVEQGVSSVKDLEKQVYNIDFDGGLDEIFVESIRRGKVRSTVMLAHIDKCLALLEQDQNRKNTPEKYLAFRYFYLDGMSYESIAEVYGYSERTARRWINELIRILGIYLYGVDGLRM